MAWFIGVSLIVVAAVFGFLMWLNWWLPQFQTAVGR